MDFTQTTEAIDAGQLAAGLFGSRSTPERLREIDAQPARHDADLWQVLGSAGLLGLTVPEEYDGAGLGLLPLVAVLEQQGRHVAPVPLATHAAAALAIATHGSDEQRATWLPRAASGEALLTVDVGGPVLGAPLADAVVRVDPDGLTLLTDPQVEEVVLSSREPAGRVTAGSTEALGDAAAAALTRQRLTTALAAWQLGVVSGALAETAGYAGEREQFGRPIGTFQAVSQRLAEGYIDVLGLRLTVQQAAWRLDEGLDAAEAAAIAAFWAAEAGHRLAHTAVHVHGGVGIDLDGVTHRWFTAAKQAEFLLGGATAAARSIGGALAAS